MDEIKIFIAILVIIAVIFQIILFFKIWGMTNDIKEIKAKIPDNDRIRDAELAYLMGNSDIAKRILDEYLKMTIEQEKESRYSDEPKLRKERILSTYKYLGINIPS